MLLFDVVLVVVFHFDLSAFTKALCEFIQTDIGVIAIHEHPSPTAETGLTSYKRNDVLP